MVKTKPIIRKNPPYEPPIIDDSIVAAFKALFSGVANEGQQKTIVKHLINDVCQYYDISYMPGDKGRRDTDFAEGKRFVAAHIITLTKIVPGGKQ